MPDPTFTAAPADIPSRAIPATFSALTDPFLVWQKTFRNELSSSVSWFALQVTDVGQSVANAAAQVTLAENQVALATAQVALAANEVDLAEAQVSLAAAEADAAAASAAAAAQIAAAWVSAAAYNTGDLVYSPIDFKTYRALTTHSGLTDDPSIDGTNWLRLSALSVASQALAEAGTDNETSMTPLRTAQAIAVLSPGLSTASTTGAAQTINFSGDAVHLSTADAATVTYTFGTPANVAKVDLIIDYSALTSYDLDTASYDSVSFSVSAQDSRPKALSFKDDGTKFYVLGDSANTVYQYSLSTAWNMSTASYDSVSFSVVGQESIPTALAFKSDGTKFYVLGTSNRAVYQYSLSTAWDMSTASYDSVTFSVNAQETSPNALSFKNDGTKFYVLGTANDTVYQYSLSTAWNMSTASYDSVSFSVVGQEGNPTALAFKNDGTKFYVVGYGANTVYQYSLSTAWDMSTASYDSVFFSVAAQDDVSNALAFKDDGTKFYVAGELNNNVYQYTSLSVSTLVFPAELELATIPLTINEKTAITIVTADGGVSYQAISTQGGIV